MGANKPIEDIEAGLLNATKSALLVCLRKISVSRRSTWRRFDAILPRGHHSMVGARENSFPRSTFA